MPTLCAVCRRHAWGFGYSPHPRSKLIWVCQDSECIAGAKKVYRMTKLMFDPMEKKAIREAGDRAGGYLDDIGETDLAKLSPEQFSQFCTLLVDTFGKSLKRITLDGEIPF